MTWESLTDVVGKAVRRLIVLASFPREIPAAWVYGIPDRRRAMQ